MEKNQETQKNHRISFDVSLSFKTNLRAARNTVLILSVPNQPNLAM